MSPADQPTRSPWLVQLADDGPPQPLEADTSADVAVVGAAIAGVATAFFVLRRTAPCVSLIERDRVARGATGRNAGGSSRRTSSGRCATSRASSVSSRPSLH